MEDAKQRQRFCFSFFGSNNDQKEGVEAPLKNDARRSEP